MKSEPSRGGRADKTPPPADVTPAATPPRRTRMELPTADLVPDPENRTISEDGDDFQGLLDSVRVMGILVALQVVRVEGRFQLIDGERRWRAARRAGVPVVACDVWPEGTNRRDVVLAGVVMNDQREPHSCLAIARRLRQVKNEFAETHEQVAARTGMPGIRVKQYLSLFGASDQLLAFLEKDGVLLRTAVELVRYEKARGEASLRRLLPRCREEGLTYREVERLRKQGERDPRTPKDGTDRNPAQAITRSLSARIEAAYRRDPEAMRRELETVVGRLGLRLVPVSQGS